jgi:hypothetical protein
MFNLRNFRNITVHQHLDQLIHFTDTVTDQVLKLTAIEMLGWFDQSWQRIKITDFCEKELAKKNLPEIYRDEVLKTKNRVQ